MEYLTTHDLVWVNNIVTGQVNGYDYVTLEAAMAGQYRYGHSEDVPAQAAILLERLLCTAPFSSGNRRTAYIATLTFLNANGYATRLGDADAASLIVAVAQGQKPAREAIDELTAPASRPLAAIPIRKLVGHECNLHVEALRNLVAGD